MNVNKTQDGANLRFLCIETRGIAQKKMQIGASLSQAGL